MTFFGNLETSSDIQQEQDFISRGGLLDSDIYTLTIKLAYGVIAGSGAKGLAIVGETEDGREVRQTFYLTSGTAKGCLNFWTDQNGKKHYLPGFNMADSLALLTVGKSITELPTETKKISLWNSEVRAEVPTDVPMFMDLIGQKIKAGIQKQLVNKTAQDSSGKWVNTAETREVNEIDKFFRERDSKTTTEIRAEAPEANYIEIWKTQNRGQLIDKVKKADPSAPRAANSSASNGGTAMPTKSLFA